MKHTTKIIDIVNFINADVIVGNALVTFTPAQSPDFVTIQSQIKGKHVFSLIQFLHSPQHLTQASSA